MPPKKAAAAKSDAAEDNSGKFSWTVDNEKKLLLFMLNTPSFSQEDNERLAAHAFPGSSHNSIRQRASKLRQEHRALHEEHGWPCPDGKPAAKDTPKKAAAPKGRKRAAAATGADDDDDAGADATPATPAKKSRKAKGKAEELAAAEELAPAGDLAGVKGEADI